MLYDEVSQDRHKLMADIAEWYYNDGLSQQDIAKKVNLSRPSISRLLLEARELSIIDIRINHPIPTANSLEIELVKNFPHLQSAKVLERRMGSEDDTMRQLGRLGADVLENVLEDNMILGLSWGTTIHSVVEELRPKRLSNVKVVQLVGGVGAPYSSIDGPEQVRRAGEIFGAQHYYLNAPLIVDTPEIAAALREDHSIKEVLELAKQSNIALLGIGPIIPEISTQFHSGYFSFQDIRDLEKLGAIGAICVCFTDIQGNRIYVPWCEDCAISIPWEDLLKIPIKIGIAKGKRKAPSILGAIRSGGIDILVTDDETAEEVLNLNKNPSA
ncbi:MAG: sugar-binding transcriptional regulator [Anaerolineales bacterium]|uniref:Sugar-binding transcriptional regulator n=1 Tax=Candidatus Desulfolinea nitratireducens TaxID=2841698 RepID=A0A8J6TFW5_9CHLR|nr:sugar-binding transcriptional regulator [Candidatus Desulfolinea nitratireducens]MBL6959641.1 sugar-binding transcriptional regulator [Anaerolineales bacterium]